jgi:hypothetical protein
LLPMRAQPRLKMRTAITLPTGANPTLQSDLSYAAACAWMFSGKRIDLTNTTTDPAYASAYLLQHSGNNCAAIHDHSVFFRTKQKQLSPLQRFRLSGRWNHPGRGYAESMCGRIYHELDQCRRRIQPVRGHRYVRLRPGISACGGTDRDNGPTREPNAEWRLESLHLVDNRIYPSGRSHILRSRDVSDLFGIHKRHSDLHVSSGFGSSFYCSKCLIPALALSNPLNLAP